MKTAIFMVIGLLALSGCVIDNNTGSPSNSNAICGNGIAEAGETYDNCCLDVACPGFHTCKELTQNEKIVNVCAKLKLEETDEYQNFLQLLKDESGEYEKGGNNINYDLILNKINLMDKAIKKLSQSYDVELEKLYVQYRYDRREWNVERAALSIEYFGKSGENLQLVLTGTDEKKVMEGKKLIEGFNKILELDKQELARMEAFSEEQVDLIRENFDYDIAERIIQQKDAIQKLEEGTSNMQELVAAYEEGYNITLSVPDYKPSCTFGCYLDYVKVQVENNGALTLFNPYFDFYIMKNGTVLAKDIDESSFSEAGNIYEGDNKVIKFSLIGFDDREKVSEGSFMLKVDIKSGTGLEPVSSITVPITITG